MKIFLYAIVLILSIIGVIILIRLYKYIKQHANEELETHESYIFSRFAAIAVLGIGSFILNLIAIFLPM